MQKHSSVASRHKYPLAQIEHLYSVSLALLDLLQRLHRSVQSVLVVSSELWVCAFQGRISVCLWLLDTTERELSAYALNLSFTFPITSRPD